MFLRTYLKKMQQLDANHVKAGTVTFEVSNAPDTGLTHELKMDRCRRAGSIKGGRWRTSTPARTSV